MDDEQQIFKIKYARIFRFDREKMAELAPTGFSPEEFSRLITEKMEQPSFFELEIADEESIMHSPYKNKDAGKHEMITYKNTKTREYLRQDFAGKPYIVKDSLEDIPWKFTEEAKEIQGFEVKKATYDKSDKGEFVTAWYAPDIEYPTGPDKYWGLPGLILELVEEFERNDMDLERTVFKCVDYSFEEKTKEFRPSGFEVIDEDTFWEKVQSSAG